VGYGRKSRFVHLSMDQKLPSDLNGIGIPEISLTSKLDIPRSTKE
jgi:hypothetical protein